MNRTRHLTWLIAIGGLLFSLPAAEAKVPRSLIGKAFFSTDRIKDTEEPALVAQFKGQKPSIELTRDKEKHWKANMVAFFRKPSAYGPITIWLYDKADKAALRAKQPVHVLSVNNNKPLKQFVYELDIDPNFGFNKGYTYLIKVGQIIGKRSRVYASGTVVLKP